MKLLRNQWVQLALFFGIYGVFHFAYFTIPNEVLSDVVYFHGLGVVAAKAINAVAPAEAVAAVQNHIRSNTADLEIVRGCDGAGALFLVVAAVLAFPAPIKNKCVGVLSSIALMYFLNLLRICSLYFIIAYHPAWFTAVHVYLAPTLIIVLACLFFAWWAVSAVPKLDATR